MRRADLREDVVQGVVGGRGDRANAAAKAGVRRVHELVDERLVGAEGATDFDRVVVHEVAAA